MAEVKTPTKILVVEDETIIAINICNSLQQFGYETEYVTTGEAALKRVQDQNFDLILMDIMLGEGIDGIETAQKIREFKNIPIVYLTAYSDQGTLQRAQVTEPFGYIIKPFHARELYITIELALHKFHSEEALKEFQKQLYESQKMESIGFLSNGIAHEINNPLTGILNFSVMGKEKAKELGNEELRHYFHRIEEEAERVSFIIKSLMNLSKEDRGHWSYLDLGVGLDEVVTFFKQLFIKESISLKIHKEENLPMVYCQAQKIKQAILNLIGFSRSSALSTPDGMNRWIQIEILKRKGENNQDFLVMIFSNSGSGIQSFLIHKEKLDKDPGFKSLSITGIGIYLSQAIAREHSGDLRITHEKNIPSLVFQIPIHPQSNKDNPGS